MLDMLIKSAILLAAVAIADRLLRRQAAAVRHLLWVFAILGVLAIPVLSRYSPFHFSIARPHAMAPYRSAQRVVADVEPSSTPVPSPSADLTSGDSSVAGVGTTTPER